MSDEKRQTQRGYRQFQWGRPSDRFMLYMPVAMRDAWDYHEFKRRVLVLLDEFLAEQQQKGG
jgi:hypothetical protein